MPDLLGTFWKNALLYFIFLVWAGVEACGNPTSLSGDASAPDRTDLQQEADRAQEPVVDTVEIQDEVPEYSDPPGDEMYEDFVEWEITPYDGPTWAVLMSGMYENDTKTVCETPDGGFLAVGWAATRGWYSGDSMWVVKLDAHGRMVWQDLLIRSEDADGKGVHCLDDGTSLVTAVSIGDLVAAKLSEDGRVLWARGYNFAGNLDLFSVSQGRNGRIMAVGNFGSRRLVTASLDETGGLEWVSAFDSSEPVHGSAAVMTADGGCVAMGQRGLLGDAVSMVLFRLAPDGTLVWQRVLEGPLFSTGTAMARLPGEVFAATASVYGEGFEAWDVLVFLFNENGEILWAKTYGERDTDAGVSVRATAAGNLLVSGYTESFGAGGADSLVMMLDPAGRVLWARTFGREGWDQAWDGLETSDGGIVVTAGTMVTFEDHIDTLILKLDPNGFLAGECPTGFWREQTLDARSVSINEAEPCLVSALLSATEIPVVLREEEGVARVELLCEP